MASTRAPRRWQTPSTRRRIPGRSATSTETRVTEAGATPGGRSIMGLAFLSRETPALRSTASADVPQDDEGPRWMTAGLANDDGDELAGGAAADRARERGGAQRLHLLTTVPGLSTRYGVNATA